MYCSSCGKPIDAGSQFCEHCGARQETEPPQQTFVPPPADFGTTAPVDTTVPVGTAVQPVEKKPMSRKTKIILGAVAGVVVLVLALRAILGAVFDPNKTISQFLEAVQNRDAEALRSVAVAVTSGGENVELTDEMLAPFFEAYSGRESTLDSMGTALREDLSYLNRGVPSQRDGAFQLVVDSNPLFSIYKVQFTPIYVPLHSEFDGTQVTLGGTEYQVSGEAAEALLLPGQYTGTATYKDPETNVVLRTDYDYRIAGTYDEMYFYFDYCSAYLYCGYDGLTVKELAVDGKPYGGSLDELNTGSYGEMSLGPLSWESEVRATCSYNGLEFERTFQMSDSTYCELEPGYVYLAGRYSGMEIKSITIDGAAYAGSLDWNGSRRLYVAPVDVGSEISVQFSLNGLDFEDTFTVETISEEFTLEPTLGDGVQEAGESMAADAVLLIVQSMYTRDRVAFGQFVTNYSASSPEMMEQWEESLRGYVEEPDANPNATYEAFSGLEANVISSDLDFDGMRLGCEVEVSWDSSVTYHCHSGEQLGDDGEGSLRASVELFYEDGQWHITYVN